MSDVAMTNAGEAVCLNNEAVLADEAAPDCCDEDLCQNVYRFDACPYTEGDWCIGFTNTIYFCEEVQCEGGGSIDGKVIRYHGVCWVQSEDDSLIPRADVPLGATIVTAGSAPDGVECVGDMDPEDPCGDTPCGEAMFLKLVPCSDEYVGDTLYICATCATRCRSVCYSDTCFLIDVDQAYTLAEVEADSGTIISSCAPVPPDSAPGLDDCCDCGDTCPWDDLCGRFCQTYYWRQPDAPFDDCPNSTVEPITYSGDAQCCCPAKAGGEGYTVDIYIYYRSELTYATGARILYEGTVGPTAGTGHDRDGPATTTFDIVQTYYDDEGNITLENTFPSSGGALVVCPLSPSIPALILAGLVGPWEFVDSAWRIEPNTSLAVEQTCASWSANYSHDSTDGNGNRTTIEFIMVVAVTPPTDREECYTDCADVATTTGRSSGSGPCCGG